MSSDVPHFMAPKISLLYFFPLLIQSNFSCFTQIILQRLYFSPSSGNVQNFLWNILVLSCSSKENSLNSIKIFMHPQPGVMYPYSNKILTMFLKLLIVQSSFYFHCLFHRSTWLWNTLHLYASSRVRKETACSNETFYVCVRRFSFWIEKVR